MKAWKMSIYGSRLNWMGEAMIVEEIIAYPWEKKTGEGAKNKQENVKMK